MIKIACIGNMNNFLFNLTRYLRNLDYDVELLLLNEPSHFKPNNDTFNDEYENYTFQLNWHSKPFWEISSKKIKNDLNKYNFLIGSNDAPAFLNKAKIKLDIFIPIGEDLYGYSFQRTKFKVKFKFDFKYYYSEIIWYYRKNSFSKNQKKGINSSKNIFLDYVPEKFNKTIQKFNIKNKISNINCPFIYNKEFNPDSIDKLSLKSNYYSFFKDLKKNNDLLIFYSCRHLWKNIPDKWSYKGTERMIHAVHKFKLENPNIKFKLITFEYGSDVKESKKLIKKLSLEENVIWLPLIPRKEIFIGLKYADIGIGEFGIGWYSYGTIFEYLSMGVPIIHYRDSKILLKNKIKYPYPMYNANTSDEIFLGINKIFNEKKFRDDLKDKNIEWFNNIFINQSLEKFIKVINN